MFIQFSSTKAKLRRCILVLVCPSVDPMRRDARLIILLMNHLVGKHIYYNFHSRFCIKTLLYFCLGIFITVIIYYFIKFVIFY